MGCGKWEMEGQSRENRKPLNFKSQSQTLKRAWRNPASFGVWRLKIGI
jgi:hypothetical protein